ncbi:hypothetical protein FDF26_15345 [Clostridium botulinum]|nr:hypothetical protein [Clostridium botulinum]
MKINKIYDSEKCQKE